MGEFFPPWGWNSFPLEPNWTQVASTSPSVDTPEQQSITAGIREGELHFMPQPVTDRCGGGIVFSGCASVSSCVCPVVSPEKFVSTISWKPVNEISPNFGFRCSWGPRKNWLGLEDRGFKVKVVIRSYVKKLGYLVNGLKDFDQILHKHSIPWLDALVAFEGLRVKVKVAIRSLRRMEASTSTLWRRSVI